MVRKYEQPEGETSGDIPYVKNHLSALMFYSYRLLKHRYGHKPGVTETLDSLRDLEVLFSRFGIKTVEKLEIVLEISQNSLSLDDSCKILPKLDDSCDPYAEGDNLTI